MDTACLFFFKNKPGSWSFQMYLQDLNDHSACEFQLQYNVGSYFPTLATWRNTMIWSKNKQAEYPAICSISGHYPPMVCRNDSCNVKRTNLDIPLPIPMKSDGQIVQTEDGNEKFRPFFHSFDDWVLATNVRCTLTLSPRPSQNIGRTWAP